MAQSIGGSSSGAAASTPENKVESSDAGTKISPARNPTKGGDFDVVKVSRVASIAIKNTGATNGYSYRSSFGGGKKAFHKKKLSPKKAAKENQVAEEKETDNSEMNVDKEEKVTAPKERRSSAASTAEKPKDKTPAKSKNDKKSNSSKKASSKDNKPVRKRAIRELQNEVDEESSDEEVIPGNDPMDVITVSPYEGNANAEKNVKLFEDLHTLLTEGSIKASKTFGDDARIMVRAYNQIEQSGMVYSQEWNDGVMRGNNVGVLPKDKLLLCLISNRLIKVDEFLMAGLTRDLELIKIIKEAVEAWDLEDEFPKIAGTSPTLKNFTFSSKRRQCFKCEIFVARAYSCYKAFGSKGRMDKSLMAKVRKGLEIMESRVPQPKDKDSKKRKKSLEKSAVVPEPPVVEEPPVKKASSPKRKRGRPPKKVVVEPEAVFEEPDEESVTEGAPMEIVEPPLSRSSSGNKRAKKGPSSADLIAKFEEQYHEMGKMYEEMGKTLALLKSAVEEDKANHEQAIRSEVRDEFMAEMQKRIRK